MRNLILVLAGVFSALLFPLAALADDCEYEKKIDMSLDVSETETLTILAKAGELTIKGDTGADKASIRGRACASKEEWLKESRVETRTGNVAKIEALLPNIDTGWSLMGNRYVRLDLELVVPAEIRLDVVDSSGSMTIEGVGPLSVKDSSGSIKIEEVGGDISVKDSSGSISLSAVEGDVTIVADSSGSIKGHGINGSVLVKKDSSGSIRFSDVTGDFVVERDSSGDIVADGVGGDFRVLKDGSGSIRSSNVEGEISVPVD